METSRKLHTFSVNDENKVRVKKLLTEAVTLLCKNSISYGAELSIEGLLGITVDSTEVYLVNFNEKVKNEATTDPGNGIVEKNVENSDASYIQRWRDRLHCRASDSPKPSDELSHRVPGVSAPKYRHQERTTPTATVNDENYGDVIEIKTERLDEDSHVTSMWTRSGDELKDMSDTTYNFASTVSTSRAFENDTDIPNIGTFSSVNTFSLKSVSDTTMPESCGDRENIEDAAPAMLPNTIDVLGVALDRKVKLADANCTEQTLSNMSLPKSNLLKPERPLMTSANEFHLRDSTGDTCAAQGNNGADFVVLDEDSAPFFYGAANDSPVHTSITGGDDSQHNQPSWRTSHMTGPGGSENKPMLPSTSPHMNVLNRIAAYTYSPMACKVCGRVLRNRTIYMRHIKTHMACMFSCHVCNREFNRKDSLRRHYLMIHKYDMSPNTELE